MFSKYGACDAAAELDGLQQITPEHLHHPAIPSISRWSQWGEVVEEWVWSARSRCDWVTQFRAKWTVMISDYVNVINRNKLLYIPFVRRWYNSNNKKKKKMDFSLSLRSSCQTGCQPDRCQFNSTAVSEEVYSEPAINCVWHLKGGVVKLSLEYLVLVEVCIQNVLLYRFDLFQI